MCIRIGNKKWENPENNFVKNHGVWQALFRFKNAITSLFSSRNQNGLHHTRGLIFLDFMQFLENQKINKKLFFEKNEVWQKFKKKSYFYNQHNI